MIILFFYTFNNMVTLFVCYIIILPIICRKYMCVKLPNILLSHNSGSPLESFLSRNIEVLWFLPHVKVYFLSIWSFCDSCLLLGFYAFSFYIILTFSDHFPLGLFHWIPEAFSTFVPYMCLIFYKSTWKLSTHEKWAHRLHVFSA